MYKIIGVLHLIILQVSYAIVSIVVDYRRSRASLEPSFISLLRELSDAVSSDWEDIGLLLKLTRGSLRVIKVDFPNDAKKCFREMIKLWLDQIDPPPSWAAIIEAINILGYEPLVEDLRKKFL